MHEYSVVQALLEQVQAATAAQPRGKVKRLHVHIGELSGVDRVLLATAYETFRERTPCAEADLDITNIAPVWRCPRCDASMAPGALLRCERCAVPARLVSGDEIMLMRVELEVPHV